MSASPMIAWLRATIEGDKVAAEALDGEVWTAVKAQGDWHIQTSQDQTFGGDVRWGELDPREAALIAAHDPRDTIARCEAKLKLLNDLLPDLESADGAISGEWNDSSSLAETLVATLAEGYRHREGFKPEWVSG